MFKWNISLHLALLALQVKAGDLVIVPTITFLATANAVRYVGADIIFSDVDPNTGNITPEILQDILNKNSKITAVIVVHLNGHPVEMFKIKKLAIKYKFKIIEDACHALGASIVNNDNFSKIGSCKYSDLSTFSFHPVKAIAMGEGGMITKNNKSYAEKIKLLRNHGILKNSNSFINNSLAFDNEKINPWYYEMQEIGFNYRASEINCALGNSQLKKLNKFIEKRNLLAQIYEKELKSLSEVMKIISSPKFSKSAWHLFVVLIDFEKLMIGREKLMNELFKHGIKSQVHYIPVHLQPYYSNRYLFKDLNNAKVYYSKCLSLPIFPMMNEKDVKFVSETLKNLLDKFKISSK